ncbi:MAG: hypothetical protein J6Y42_03915 [Bacilli bacterium]|nr:hypothetical protein [Bacilli bacterium]
MNNTEKIVTIVKYVTITFNFPSGDYEIMKLIPGSNFSDYLPMKELYLEDHSDHKYFYHAIYEWVNNNVPIPLLVPNTNKTYIAEVCNIEFPDSAAVINYSQNGKQTMASEYKVHSNSPLYFTGMTSEGGLDKEVFITTSCTNNGRFVYSLQFYVSNAIIVLGTPKSYTTTISLFKDYICSKYLGEVQITINIVSSAGPGE